MKKHIIFSGLLAASILSLAFFFVVVPTTHAQTSTSTMCPVGYTCTPILAQPVNCPAGYTCTTNPVPVPYPTPVTPPGSCYHWSTNLGIGSRGPDVVALQVWLVANGYNIPIISQGTATRGYFDPSTAAALRLYQHSVGLPSTGVLDTQTRAALSCGTATTPVSGTQIVASLDPTSPQASTVQISQSTQTRNVPLAVFDLKSQGNNSTLRSLNFRLWTSANASSTYASNLFGNTQIRLGGLTYAVQAISQNGNYFDAVFTNLNIPLPADANVPITVLLNVPADTSGLMNDVQVAANLTVSAASVYADDASYHQIPVNSAVITGSTLTLSESSVQVSNTSAVLGNPTCSVATQACTQQATFTFSLTAGNQPIFVSNKETTALAGSLKTSLSTSLAVSPVNFSDNDTSGDSSTYFYVAPGQTKTFTAIYQITANGPTVAGVFSINPIFYGTSASNLTSNSITSGLQNLQVTVSFNGGSTQLPSLSINPASVVSGQKVTFSYVIPSNATSMGLFLSCPTGVSMPYGNGGNENCNTNMKWSPSFPTASIFTAINNSSIAQTVGAFLQVTYPDGSSGGINGLFVIQPAQSTSTQPSITVVSPNGGETWVKGTTQYIKWTSTPSMPYQLGQPGDIKLEFAVPACAEPTANPRCMIAVRAPLTIASGVNLNSVSYAWKVGQVLNNTQSNLPSINIVPDGQYKIQICPTNVNSSTQCDDSNNYFNITSGTPTPVSQPPVITGGTFPTTLQVNQTGTWTVNAYDPKNGSLSYSVNWGDVPYACQVGQPCVKPMSTAIQSSTFTHSYSYSGTYTITFTVKNAAGLSAQTTSTVKVVTTTPVCPAGYICTPPNQTTTCPAGYTCTNVTPNCPPNYICYTQTPTLTPIINSSNSYQSSSSKTSTVTAASTQSGWQSFLHFLGF
jgi:hypothetical protein